MTIDPVEHPVSLQLFGSDPEILGQIAAQIEERPFDILDLTWAARCQRLSITAKARPL